VPRLTHEILLQLRSILFPVTFVASKGGCSELFGGSPKRESGANPEQSPLL